MKYRKIPLEVDAAQWFENGDHPDVKPYIRPDIDYSSVCHRCARRMLEHGWLYTFEGGHIVCPGDFIITGILGEIYPCKPNIFKKTYEEV